MNIDFNQVVQQKLAQMEAEGVIQKKIEDALEKAILNAIDSQLGSYSFQNALGKQLEDGVSRLAKDCGLSAYNGFIAERVKDIISGLASDDMSKKIENAVRGVLVRRYEGIKLSDIFKRYRKHVMEFVDDSDKYDREMFTMQLEQHEGYSSGITHYACRFSPFPDYDANNSDAIEIRFCQYREDNCIICSLLMGGLDMSKTLNLGYLDTFDEFLVNLFLNKTEIIMDADDAEDAAADCAYIDY